MKMNTSQIIIIAAVVVLLSVAYMYMTGGVGGKNGAGKTIVTEMPQVGYSIDNDGYADDGLPEALPETLPPPPEVDVPEPEMLGMADDPATAAATWGSSMTTTPGPVVQDTEEFTQYAPRRFKGDIL
jgi:hypothetical protein